MRPIDDAAKHIAIMQAPNMSLGVNLLFKVAAHMAKVLGDDYDIEITELHHRFKKDAPFRHGHGHRRCDPQDHRQDARCSGVRPPRRRLPAKRGEIGMQALRLGDEVGKHTVYFGALGERLELTHTATTRDTFAHGALKAAIWLAGQKPGRYTMADVLGL